MKESFKCFLKILSPVHIGCDEIYEPMGFVMDEQARQIIAFDPLYFISQMEVVDKQRFSEICLEGTVSSILEIYKFLKDRTAEGRHIDVCQGFVDHYHKTLDISVKDKKRIQQELNRFTIERTSFSPGDHRPYIPGSAIKGALRTAYLNARAEKKKVPTPRGRYAAKDLEKTLLDGGAFDTDPFRLVKISDFRPVGQVKTRVVYAVNEKKMPSKFEARGPYQILEVIQPGALFEGAITVDMPQTKKSVSSPISIQGLLESVALFFRKEIKREDDDLKRINIPGVQILDNEDMFLIRLGRHSGAESVTIEGHRNIKIMMRRGEKPKYLDLATTLWLASEAQKPKIKENLRPFGWAELCELSATLAEAFQEKEKGWKVKAEEERRAMRAERERKREQKLQLEQKATEKAERRKIEEDKMRKEEEQRRAVLEAMTPEEREIAEIRDPSVLESRVVEIYNRIDDFSGENKTKLALALKAYWEVHGKWEKQKGKKTKGVLKQIDRVEKIKKIWARNNFSSTC